MPKYSSRVKWPWKWQKPLTLPHLYESNWSLRRRILGNPSLLEFQTPMHWFGNCLKNCDTLYLGRHWTWAWRMRSDENKLEHSLGCKEVPYDIGRMLSGKCWVVRRKNMLSRIVGQWNHRWKGKKRSNASFEYPQGECTVIHTQVRRKREREKKWKKKT